MKLYKIFGLLLAINSQAGLPEGYEALRGVTIEELKNGFARINSHYVHGYYHSHEDSRLFLNTGSNLSCVPFRYSNYLYSNFKTINAFIDSVGLEEWNQVRTWPDNSALKVAVQHALSERRKNLYPTIEIMPNDGYIQADLIKGIEVAAGVMEDNLRKAIENKNLESTLLAGLTKKEFTKLEIKEADTIAKLNELYLESQTALASLKEQLAQEKESSEAIIKGLKSDLESLGKAKEEELARFLEEKANEIAALTKENAELASEKEAEKSALREKLETSEAKKAKTNSDFVNLQIEYSKLFSNYSGLITESEELRSRLSYVSSNLSNLKSKNEELSQIIASILSDGEFKQAQVESLQHHNNELRQLLEEQQVNDLIEWINLGSRVNSSRVSEAGSLNGDDVVPYSGS